MLVWPTDFSDQLATVIIWLCFSLSAFSLICITAIIIRHRKKEKELERRIKRKQEIERLIHICLDVPAGVCDDKTGLLDENDYSIIIEIAVEWLRSVVGDDATHIVSILRFWGIEQHIDRCLSEGTLSEITEALIYCSYDNTKKTEECLLRFCNDQNPVVQLICLQGLAKRGKVEALSKALDIPHVKQFTSKLILADIFLKLGKDGVPYLINEMQRKDVSVEIRTACLIALGHMRALESVDAILALLRKHNLDPDIRAQGVLALGLIGDYRGVQAVMRHLSDKHLGVRVQAIHAAGHMNSELFIPKLAQLLKDDEWWVRYRSAEVIGKIGGLGLKLLAEAASRNDLAGQAARDVLIERSRVTS